MPTCKHPTCGPVCRRQKPEKKKYTIPQVSRNDLPLLHKKAEAKVHLYIRLRDKDKPCICGCGGKVEHAGHFFPAGSYSGVMYDEANVNGQARNCNFFDDGTAINPNYEIGLIARVGMATVMDLRNRAIATRMYKWTREELIEIAERFDKMIKELKQKNHGNGI